MDEETSMTDPDLLETTPVPIVAPAGAACDADAPAGTHWSEWTTDVSVAEPATDGAETNAMPW